MPGAVSPLTGAFPHSVVVASERARACQDGLSHIKLCRAYLHCQKPPAFSTYQNEQRRWIPVKCPFEELSLPNQIRAHSLMTQHCCRELTGGLSLCSMERITHESQTTARSCTLSRKRLGGPRTMRRLGASQRLEKTVRSHHKSQLDHEGGVPEALPQVVESGRDRRPRPPSWRRPTPLRRRRRSPPPRSVSDLPQAPQYVP